MQNILVVFPPICRDFFIDISKEIILKKKNIVINGIFYDDKKIIEKIIKKSFPKKNIGKFYFVKDDDPKIISSFKTHEAPYDENIINRMISADRIAGAGYMQNVRYRAKLIYGSIFLNNTDLPRKYCTNLYFYLDNILNVINPKFILVHSVSSALTLGLHHLAKKKNIIFLSPKHTRLNNYFIIDEYEIGNIKKISKTFNDFENNKISNEVKSESMTLLSNLLNKKSLPEYYERNKNQKNKYSLFYLFLKGIKRIFISLITFKINKEVIGNSFLEFFVSINKNTLKWTEQIPNKYVYYPLQVDPEASTMVESYIYTDQAYVIEVISKSLPNDYTLVVKEHIPMIGLRKNIFYKRISNLPNVLIVDAYIHPHEIIKNSKLTISITGTVSWESLCFGVPSIVLEKVPHLIINNGIFHLDNIKHMPQLIKQSLNYKMNNKNKILNYISAIILNSLKLESGFLWGDYSYYDNSKKTIGVKKFYEQLKNYF